MFCSTLCGLTIGFLISLLFLVAKKAVGNRDEENAPPQTDAEANAMAVIDPPPEASSPESSPASPSVDGAPSRTSSPDEPT